MFVGYRLGKQQCPVYSCRIIACKNQRIGPTSSSRIKNVYKAVVDVKITCVPLGNGQSSSLPFASKIQMKEDESGAAPTSHKQQTTRACATRQVAALAALLLNASYNGNRCAVINQQMLPEEKVPRYQQSQFQQYSSVGLREAENTTSRDQRASSLKISRPASEAKDHPNASRLARDLCAHAARTQSTQRQQNWPED